MKLKSILLKNSSLKIFQLVQFLLLTKIYIFFIPETHFTVINKAGASIKLVDKSGAWSMDFPPVENTETLPQVAVTLKKQAVFKALLVTPDGKLGDPLLINGEQEFVIEAGKAPETSLVIHKEG